MHFHNASTLHIIPAIAHIIAVLKLLLWKHGVLGKATPCEAMFWHGKFHSDQYFLNLN